MEQLLFSLNATIPVFLVMVIGYVLQQLHVTNDSFVKTLNYEKKDITIDMCCGMLCACRLAGTNQRENNVSRKSV